MPGLGGSGPAYRGRAGLEPRRPKRNQAPFGVPRLQEPPPYSWTTLRPTRASVPQTTPVCAAPSASDTFLTVSILIGLPWSPGLTPETARSYSAPGLRPRSAAFAPRSARLVMRRSPRSFRSPLQDGQAPGLQAGGATFSFPSPHPLPPPPVPSSLRGDWTPG